jgi:hypothetical protein
MLKQSFTAVDRQIRNFSESGNKQFGSLLSMDRIADDHGCVKSISIQHLLIDWIFG